MSPRPHGPTGRIRAPERTSGLSRHRRGESTPGLDRREFMAKLAMLSRGDKLANLDINRVAQVKCQDIEFSLDFDPDPGLADNGDLRA